MPRRFAPVAPVNALPIGQLLQLQATRNPRSPALTCDGTTLTRAELAARVHRRARAMAATGVTEGDFVAIALPNGSAFLEVAFACWALGATPAPLSHRLPAAELQSLLQVLQPRLVVGADAARAAGASVGTDHAWGGHYMVMGGGVQGGRFYGQFPDLTLGGPSDADTSGRWIPTTSIEQYGATLGRWFGVPDVDLAQVFPGLSRFPTGNLGFMG